MEDVGRLEPPKRNADLLAFALAAPEGSVFNESVGPLNTYDLLFGAFALSDTASGTGVTALGVVVAPRAIGFETFEIPIGARFSALLPMTAGAMKLVVEDVGRLEPAKGNAGLLALAPVAD